VTPVNHCPICGGRDVRNLNHYGPRCLVGDYHITSGQVENVWCGRCGAGWNRLMLGDEELAQFYASYTKKVASADEDDLLFSVSSAEAETLTASQTRFLAAHVDASSGRILDIGCGKGAFLRSFLDHRPGWQCVGIEPSREEAELARRGGQIEVHEGMLGAIALPPGSFDLVSIMHVFEHVTRPIETLRQMHDLLKPGGVLFIEVPNTADMNMFYDLLLFEHLYHFTPETLAWLLAREGFDVVAHERSTTYGAQRVVARKAARPQQLPWPELTMAEGFAKWQRLWSSMSQLAALGATAAQSGQRVGIFGAGMTAATWLVHTSLSDAPLVGLFDESQWKIGHTLFDRPIHALSDIRAHQLDLVLVATMPNSQLLVKDKLSAICDARTRIEGFGEVA
jgi:2-polyprenyl-3-methyl-5-hydroxy-6-metoxy-1,4-benzoquinol methylase